MRHILFRTAELYNREQVSQINEAISKNFIPAEDGAAKQANKSSEVKFLRLGKIGNIINPFIQFCLSANIDIFGFDLYPLNSDKIVNYNIYKKDTEYSWHTDGEPLSPIRDIKLTCLLNLSEDDYSGGDLFLFDGGQEKKTEKFNNPGTAIIFPSFINHKVSKLISGKRTTLAIWWYGPKFR